MRPRGRYRRGVDRAICSSDSTPLRVLERRKGDDRGPLLVCPSCDRRFELGERGPQEVSPTA